MADALNRAVAGSWQPTALIVSAAFNLPSLWTGLWITQLQKESAAEKLARQQNDGREWNDFLQHHDPPWVMSAEKTGCAPETLTSRTLATQSIAPRPSACAVP